MVYLKFYFRSTLSLWFNKVIRCLGGVFLFMDVKGRRDSLLMPPYYFLLLSFFITFTHICPHYPTTTIYIL